MLSLNVKDLSFDTAEILQVPTETKVLNVRYARHPVNTACIVSVHCNNYHRVMLVFHIVVKDDKLLLVYSVL